jgi:hypothetical protein
MVVMKLDEVADKYALDTVFAYYPVDGTVAELEQVANACENYFDSDEWILAEDVQDLAFISASAILQRVFDEAWSFKRYYEMVGE